MPLPHPEAVLVSSPSRKAIVAGTLRVAADTTPLPLAEWARQYFYQTGAFVKVALDPGC